MRPNSTKLAPRPRVIDTHRLASAFFKTLATHSRIFSHRQSRWVFERNPDEPIRLSFPKVWPASGLQVDLCELVVNSLLSCIRALSAFRKCSCRTCVIRTFRGPSQRAVGTEPFPRARRWVLGDARMLDVPMCCLRIRLNEYVYCNWCCSCGPSHSRCCAHGNPCSV